MKTLWNNDKVQKEHDFVRLTSIVDDEGARYPIGTTGAVVSVYNEGQAFAVEVVDGFREPTVITVLATQVEPVKKKTKKIKKII